MILSRRSAVALAATVLTLYVTPLAMVRSVGAAEFATRGNDAGGVRVDVTPKSVAAGSAWQFEVVMDTHTKPLNDDLTKTAVLVDDGGRKYAPLDWQGDKPGGHHRNGVIKFNSFVSASATVTLKLVQVGGIGERIFVWRMR